MMCYLFENTKKKKIFRCINHKTVEGIEANACQVRKQSRE